ncbi:histidinol-phosphatase [Acididesulfobacillus acetoxydans]|uniref:Histidinol-phosphatase n=1 Tax=Acididesulfobacillus acetoxydans TaxID=1561005 RepID=A0A8S0Y090_9FIRM|nr:histidinol-phosphatase HisJ family protein [Acididesulfobacillus acetoxydans]CAA7602927.1 histidinol-phosphatase [Acididesulfobacillus acetoxydans]CEJ05809.1 Histidinol phosphatase [Acididesulfobacillus acetoxydans]
MLDLHVHLTGHRDRPADRENVRAFLRTAAAKGLREVGFADHDLYYEDLNLPLLSEVAAEFPGLKVRVGLEVDYRPGEEEKVRGILASFPFDYAIGSVHEIRGWAFDAPGQEQRHREAEPDRLYRDYFGLVVQAARSGLFTTLGHLDLIKIYGVRPKSDILELAEETLAAAAETGCAIEINTNGRNKPVGEFYPEERLLKEIIRRHVPITLGSDAHEAAAVGRDLAEAAGMARRLGAEALVGFEQRRLIPYPIVAYSV